MTNLRNGRAGNLGSFSGMGTIYLAMSQTTMGPTRTPSPSVNCRRGVTLAVNIHLMLKLSLDIYLQPIVRVYDTVLFKSAIPLCDKDMNK